MLYRFQPVGVPFSVKVSYLIKMILPVIMALPIFILQI